MADSPFALPEAALAAWLETHLPGFRGPLVASKFKGGQSNPTYRIDGADGRSLVLRRKPPGQLLKSAHAVDREFRVLQALHGRGVPVAEPLLLCSDESVIGSMFYVMQFVPGTVYWDPALPELDRAGRTAHYQAIVATLAALHAVDPAAVGLADFGQPGNYFARQLRRWSEQYRASETGNVAAMDALIAWLEAHVPPDDGAVALVHGDFRIDNLMFAADRSEVLAVVDWELSTLGHPLADLSYFCMALRLPRSPVLLSGLAGLDRAALGIPSEAQLVEHYASLRGLDRVEHWNFSLAFNFFRLGAIAQGVYKRAQQGNASNAQALQVGAIVPVLAGMGLDVAG